MPLLDHFDILAPFYERVIRPADPQALGAHLRLPVPGALLDAGGGTGRVAHGLRGQAGRIVVADLSQRMLTEAAKREALNPVCAHSERLPFPDGFFERIIMVDALHHVCDQRRTAAELWRVLAAGGLLVIEEPDLRTFGVKMLAVGEKLALMRSHFLNPHRISDLFRHPDARVQVAAEKSIAWIIVEKAPSPQAIENH
ncbi:MAG: class I SAM-dependent methyltransferase [Anaerolineales bacterium]|nr:class I SAM-dependent methyltransferase [Anaerolineales bacterium]